MTRKSRSPRACRIWIVAAFCVTFVTAPVPTGAAELNVNTLLKNADQNLRAGDTLVALREVRASVADPTAGAGLVEECARWFSTRFRSPADSGAAISFFSLAIRAPASPGLPTVLTLLMDNGLIESEAKLSMLRDLKTRGVDRPDIVDAQVQLLRRLGRLDPALELAAHLAQRTGRIDHRVMVVDILLDLSRTADAAALAKSILSDSPPDISAFSMISDRFYRHGDYRNTLDIHDRARAVFSNPMLFFDPSVNICQGLQLGIDGVELYLPILLDGTSTTPAIFYEFLSMITDPKYLAGPFLAKLSAGSNSNVMLSSVFRFAEIADDTTCMNLVRTYRAKFGSAACSISMAEHLLLADRFAAFRAVLDDLPDTPPETAEVKRMLLFRSVLREKGPDGALAQYPPASFTVPGIRATVQRTAAAAFIDAGRLTDGISALKAAQDLAPEGPDDLMLARLYFLAGDDSSALACAYRAHRVMPSEETLYWLGWLSLANGDTSTARTAFRDAAQRAESFLADESLAWLVALNLPGESVRTEISRRMRDALRGRAPAPGEDALPTAARIALRRESVRGKVKPSDIDEGTSILLRYLRWEMLDRKDRSEAQYQKLLRDAPEHLRPLIRTEEP